LTGASLVWVGGQNTPITFFVFSNDPTADSGTTITDGSTLALGAATLRKLAMAPFTITPAALGGSLTNYAGSISLSQNVVNANNTKKSYLDGSVSAVAIEFNPTTWSSSQQTNQYGFLIGATTNNDEAIWFGQSQVLIGPNSRNEGSYSNILPTLGAKNIIAADLGQSIWAMAVNGYVSHTDPVGAGWGTTRVRPAVSGILVLTKTAVPTAIAGSREPPFILDT